MTAALNASKAYGQFCVTSIAQASK